MLGFVLDLATQKSNYGGCIQFMATSNNNYHLTCLTLNSADLPILNSILRNFFYNNDKFLNKMDFYAWFYVFCRQKSD